MVNVVYRDTVMELVGIPSSYIDLEGFPVVARDCTEYFVVRGVISRYKLLSQYAVSFCYLRYFVVWVKPACN